MNLNKILKIFILLGLTTILINCKKSNNEYEEDEENQEESFSEENGYSDGTYCAEIDYYYSKTGTNSTYTLLVEIENNELTKIHWPNGGWLDDSHFAPQDISNGEASFTSDIGADYIVKIIGNEGDCSTSSYVTDEDRILRQNEDDEIRDQEEEEERVKQEEQEKKDRLQKLEEEEKKQTEEEEENNEE